jgi:hypothetical protein
MANETHLQGFARDDQLPLDARAQKRVACIVVECLVGDKK